MLCTARGPGDAAGTKTPGVSVAQRSSAGACHLDTKRRRKRAPNILSAAHLEHTTGKPLHAAAGKHVQNAELSDEFMNLHDVDQLVKN